MHEQIKSILDSIKAITREPDNDPYFNDSRYKPFPFSESNFYQIKASEPALRIAFIDGGQAQLLASQDICVGMIRTYASVFEKNKKINDMSKKSDAYVLVYSAVEGEKINYIAKTFPLNHSTAFFPPEIRINSMDETIRDGIFMADIGKIISLARKISEWLYARNMCDLLSPRDMVVKDGTLQVGINTERQYVEELYEIAAKNCVVVSAVSKKSSIFTKTGRNFLVSLKKKQPEGCWYYMPIADIRNPDHRADMSAVKLNKNSQYVFRLETLKNQGYDINKIASMLSSTANDYRFPGYPYGLIDADNNARITENEKNYHSALFTSAIKHIDTTTADAHDVLNRIVK